MNDLYAVPTIDQRIRIPFEVIVKLAEEIAERYHPIRVILFGSYAYGTPRPESDVDLLVVMNTSQRETRLAVQIRESLDVPFGVDIIVRRPDNLQQRLAWGDSFLREIVDKGIVLYESAGI